MKQLYALKTFSFQNKYHVSLILSNVVPNFNTLLKENYYIYICELCNLPICYWRLQWKFQWSPEYVRRIFRKANNF